MSPSDTPFLIGGDLPVSRIGYGAMRLTGPDLWGPYPDHEEGVRVLRGAVDAGVTLIDTADVYGPHTNELLVRDAFHPYPDELVIATKGGLVRGGVSLKRISAVGNPDYLRQSIYMSLQRLNRDRIDLYYLHTGRATDAPWQDQIGVLAEFRDRGLIRHVGLSNITVDQLDQARAIVPVAAVTAHYNVAGRSNQDLLDATLASGAAFVPWQPVSLATPGDDIDTSGAQHLRAVLKPIAAAHDASIPQVSLAWLLGIAPGVLPIPATTSLDHLRQNLAALQLELTADERAAIDALGS
jgi:pyridoxine 4-dehydrogenase